MSDLKPRTIRLTPEEWDNLDQEAEEHGFGNRTEYVRYLIRNRGQLVGDRSDQIEEHEERIAELEDQINTLESHFDVIREMVTEQGNEIKGLQRLLR